MTNQPVIKVTQQFGAERVDFTLAGARAMLLKPIQPARDGARHWIFCAPVFMGPDPARPDLNPTGYYHPIDADLPEPASILPLKATHKKLFQRLLESGFYIGGIEVGESMGNPAGCAQYTAYYHSVVNEYQLDPQPGLYATSRGGLMHYNWAADHPDWVRCIGANQPVLDLALFPGLGKAAVAYGMPLEDFKKIYRRHNPIDRLEPLATHKIHIFHIVGEADRLLPYANQMEMYRRYTALGGTMQIIGKQGVPHGLLPELLEDMAMYDFFMKQAGRSSDRG